MPNLNLENALDSNAKPIKVDDEMTPLEVSTNKLWYQRTPSDLYEVANKKYVDDNTSTPDTVQYYYDIKFSSYHASSVSNYVPLNGSIIEKASVSSSNEYVGWVAPYNGIIEKAFFRSEALQNGTFEINTAYSADGTETPTTMNMRFVEGSMNIADDTTYEADFTGSLYAGDNTIVKGRIYAIKVTTPANSLDTNITFVFKWDVTT